MTFKLELYTDSWVDVSNYVINSLAVPFIKRNKDFTISAEGFILYLSQNIDSDIPENATEVKFYVDNEVKFDGIIKGRYFNRTSYRHELTIYDRIFKLKDYKIEYSVLNAALLNTSDSSKSLLDSLSRRWFSIPHILDSMFSVAGLTVDTSELYSTTYNVVVSKAMPDNSVVNFKTRELLINQNTLYCIGQNYATTPTGISNNNVSGYNFEDQKITFFDFVSFICSICALQFQYEDGLVLKQVSYINNYTSFDSDYLFDKSEEVTEAENTDYKCTMLFASMSDYYSDTPTAIYPNYTKNDEGEYIEWLNNLIIGFYAGSGSMYNMGVGAFLRPIDLNIFYKARAKTMKGAFAEVETSVKIDARSIVENIIVLTAESRVSQIVHGSYNDMGLLP